MRAYILRRLLMVIPTLLAVSMVSFIIIDLPPGDWLTDYVANLRQQDVEINQEIIDGLRQQYGFDQPLPVRYVKWMRGVLQGDFGQSFQYRQSVKTLIGERLGLTLVVTFAAFIFTWVMALPIGVYSAVKQYSPGDYLATFIGFIGVSVPDFLLGLVLMFIVFKYRGIVIGGLFSEQFVDAPWSMARVKDFLDHLWLPMVIMGLSGTAGLIRIMRANLLDELHKPYVVTARARGLPEWRLIMKYPVRLAMNPFVSGLAFVLPSLVSGGIILASVLNLPIAGTQLLSALRSQDMYLAGAYILLLSVLTVIGTFISDLLLAWLDPRIRYGLM